MKQSKAGDLVKRAREKFPKAEAFELRTIAHGWSVVDECVILGAPELARKLLKALDALAIVYDAEDEAREVDAMLEEVNERQQELGAACNAPHANRPDHQ